VVSKDGSLLTYLKVDGSKQIIGDTEYSYLVEGSTIKMGSRFDRQGHALQIFFVRDPSRTSENLSNLMRSSRKTAQAIDLSVEDVFDER